jgi:hypothetical protein
LLCNDVLSKEESVVKNLKAIFFIAVISVVAGFIWDILVWRLHFPYLPFHWLGPLIHADGESAYSAMMYEMMLFFFVVFVLAWTLFKLSKRC